MQILWSFCSFRHNIIGFIKGNIMGNVHIVEKYVLAAVVGIICF